MNQPCRNAGLLFVCWGAVASLRLASLQLLPISRVADNRKHTANRFTCRAAQALHFLKVKLSRGFALPFPENRCINYER
jgi:hypothetical protein